MGLEPQRRPETPPAHADAVESSTYYYYKTYKTYTTQARENRISHKAAKSDRRLERHQESSSFGQLPAGSPKKQLEITGNPQKLAKTSENRQELPNIAENQRKTPESSGN